MRASSEDHSVEWHLKWLKLIVMVGKIKKYSIKLRMLMFQSEMVAHFALVGERRVQQAEEGIPQRLWLRRGGEPQAPDHDQQAEKVDSQLRTDHQTALLPLLPRRQPPTPDQLHQPHGGHWTARGPQHAAEPERDPRGADSPADGRGLSAQSRLPAPVLHQQRRRHDPLLDYGGQCE